MNTPETGSLIACLAGCGVTLWAVGESAELISAACTGILLGALFVRIRRPGA